MTEAFWLKTVKRIKHWSFGVFQVLDYVHVPFVWMYLTSWFGLFISPISSLFVHVSSHFNTITVVSSCGNVEVMLKNSLVSRCRHRKISMIEVCMSLWGKEKVFTCCHTSLLANAGLPHSLLKVSTAL